MHHIHASIPNNAANLPPLPLPVHSVPGPSVPGPTLPLPLPLPLALALALHMNGKKWFSKQVDSISMSKEAKKKYK